jgi:hypothetical protein
MWSNAINYSPSDMGLTSTVTAIATGEAHTCALLADGGLRCWGQGDSGELGDGSMLNRSAPVAVSGIGPLAPESLAIVPGSPALAYGAELALSAMGTYADGSTADLTSTVRWASWSTSVATIGASTGVAYGVGAGDTQITARLDGLTASTTFTVYAIPPSPPRDVSARGVGASARLQWLPPASDGGIVVTGYTATVTPGGQMCTTTPWWSGGEDTSCTISGLADGVYTATVVASNYVGSSPPSAPSGPFTVRGSAPIATLTSAASPTRADVLHYTVAFDEPVTGLTEADFGRTGTATGCVVGSPVGTDSTYSLDISGCSDGTIVLTLLADSVSDAATNLGPTNSVVAEQVTLDRTPPSTPSFSAITPQTGLSLSGASVLLRLAWTTSADSGSGLAPTLPYQLEQSVSGGIWTSVDAYGGPTAGVAASSSGTVRFRVRAIDIAGNVGGWAYTPTMSPRLVQQTSTHVKYGGVWSTSKSSTYSAGSLKHAKIGGSTATYTFTGRSIGLVTTKGASRGKVKIYVNGTRIATIDLYRATFQYRAVAWQKTWSASVTRTIKLVVVGTNGRPRVDLDAFVVMQ